MDLHSPPLTPLTPIWGQLHLLMNFSPLGVTDPKLGSWGLQKEVLHFFWGECSKYKARNGVKVSRVIVPGLVLLCLWPISRHPIYCECSVFSDFNDLFHWLTGKKYLSVIMEHFFVLLSLTFTLSALIGSISPHFVGKVQQSVRKTFSSLLSCR